ncbi:unnamed protein product [Didymodactylos carnosus]|uniref:Uncharacterized protein n=1 Tax=Didymodactylos carnosus TaxID=1234261 RepID=A0A8S2D5M6_9BILA|nr:unnamed protein product [Didymodactylos carnosus]CAF3592553.1 unnamed protein product [Didymodactylos carnosus]
MVSHWLLHLCSFVEATSSLSIPKWSASNNSLNLAACVFPPMISALNPFFDTSIEKIEQTNLGSLVTSGKPLFILTLVTDLLRRTRRGTDVSTANSSLYDTQLSSQSFIDQPWEEMITAGPTAIQLLGQVIVISSRADFSVEDSKPADGFKYMQFPRSFRATLIQISNEGWSAFMNAHTNMNKIQLYMQQVPEHIKTSLQIIASGTPRLLENLLPMTLQSISRIGQECVSLSQETHNKFADVMALLGEVVAVTAQSQGIYVMKTQLNNIGEEIDKEYADIKQSIKNAQDAYTQAMRDIPTGWSAVLQGLVQSIGNVVVRSIGGLVDAFSSNIKNGGLSGGRTGLDAGKDILSYSKQKATSTASGFLQNLLDFSNRLTNILQKGSSENPVDIFKAFKLGFSTTISLLSDNDESNQQVRQYITQGIDIIDELTNIFKSGSINSSDTTISEVTDKISALINEVKSFVSAGVVSGSKDGVASPITTQLSPESGIGANEKFKAQLARQQLEMELTRSDAIFSQMMQQRKELKDLMVRIASLDLTQISYQEIIEILNEAIRLLSNIREQWAKLVQFFSEIAVRSQIAVNETLVPFVEKAKQVKEQSKDLTTYERSFYIGLLKDQSVRINQESYLLFIMSRTYYDISGKYMLDRLAGLSKLLSAKSDAERTQLSQQLSVETNKTQEEIEKLARERKQVYRTAVNTKLAELDSFIEDLERTNDTLSIR